MMPPTAPHFSAARAALIAAALSATLFGFVSSAPNSAQGFTTQVKPGQLIQAAIDAAPSGHRIIVEAGTYAEQLTITKDGIALIGHGAILVPPKVFPSRPNGCYGLAGNYTQVGICVIGSNVELAPYKAEHRKVLSVGTAVKDVSITGFEVIGFNGSNIALVGGCNTKLTRNKLINGTTYGLLTAGSNDTRVTDNIVKSSELNFIAICTDDLSGTLTRGNRVSGYSVGLCVQTSGADVRFNDATNTCFGIYVDPFVQGAKIRYNHVGYTNPLCANATGATFGIAAGGSANGVIQYNLVEGQSLGGLATGIVGAIAVFDDPDTFAVASGNRVTQNTLRNNTLDILVFTNATNVIEHNKCSTPKELCNSE